MTARQVDGIKVWLRNPDRIVTVRELRAAGYGWEDAARALAALKWNVPPKLLRSMWMARPS